MEEGLYLGVVGGHEVLLVVAHLHVLQRDPLHIQPTEKRHHTTASDTTTQFKRCLICPFQSKENGTGSYRADVVGGLDGLLERVGVTAVLVEAAEGVHQQLCRLGRCGHQRHLDTDTQSIERLTMCIYRRERERAENVRIQAAAQQLKKAARDPP